MEITEKKEQSGHLVKRWYDESRKLAGITWRMTMARDWKIRTEMEEAGV